VVLHLLSTLQVSASLEELEAQEYLQQMGDGGEGPSLEEAGLVEQQEGNDPGLEQAEGYNGEQQVHCSALQMLFLLLCSHLCMCIAPFACIILCAYHGHGARKKRKHFYCMCKISMRPCFEGSRLSRLVTPCYKHTKFCPGLLLI